MQRWAVSFDGPGQAVLATSPFPSVHGAYSLLLKTRRTLISAGTELNVLFGRSGFSNTPTFPLEPRATIVADVTDVGRAVHSVRPDLSIGARVVLRGRHASHNSCDVLSDQITVVPLDATDDHMLLARQAMVGLHALGTAGVNGRSSVHVVGLGVIGQLLARLASAQGCRRVLVSDRHEMRLQTACSVPGIERFDGGPVDAAFVACGSASAVQQALAGVADGGVLVLLGALHGDVSLDLTRHVFRRNVRIIGAHQAWASDAQPPSPSERTLMAHSVLSAPQATTGIVTHVVAPSAPIDAYNLVRDRKHEALGVVFDWSKV